MMDRACHRREQAGSVLRCSETPYFGVAPELEKKRPCGSRSALQGLECLRPTTIPGDASMRAWRLAIYATPECRFTLLECCTHGRSAAAL